MPAWKRSVWWRSCRENDEGAALAPPKHSSMMDVTDVLRDRMNEPDGLQRMVSLSVAAHVGLLATLFLAPGGWLGRPKETPETVMTITLGGGSGPPNGGMTSIGGRPVQV